MGAWASAGMAAVQPQPVLGNLVVVCSSVLLAMVDVCGVVDCGSEVVLRAAEPMKAFCGRSSCRFIAWEIRISGPISDGFELHRCPAELLSAAGRTQERLC
jgi:hypothetical protein